MTDTLSFDHLLPEGETLFDYQHVGVGYAAVTRRCFIADEQGLGKTRQALITAEATDAFPLLIVCKASLKANWEREVVRCLPNRSVEILGGSRPYEASSEIVIINFDLLATWQHSLVQDGFQGLVIDESHYCKEKGTEKKPVQRTRAALAISQSIPADGLVLLLTGTAILNRPVELVTQLQILGLLDQVAPKPRPRSGGAPSDRDWEYSFKFRYCGPKHNGHGYEFKGASNLHELNDRLRGVGYIRRERKDVLGMNETRRVDVPLSLNGALDEYRRAEQETRAFVAEKGGIEAVLKFDRAETLNRITILRRLAGLAKVEAAAEWINDWLEENEGRKLVVFGWHEDVQKAIAKATGGIYLKGAKDIEAAKESFNDGDARVIVCSLQAHREGHTLVAQGKAQDVLFIEQPWHPGAVSQAEDRINRIGQTAEQVFAWTLLAAGTIDEWLNRLIQTKWVTFKAAVNGNEVGEVSDESVQEELFRALFGEEG